jgi:hypothetical protein
MQTKPNELNDKSMTKHWMSLTQESLLNHPSCTHVIAHVMAAALQMLLF